MFKHQMILMKQIKQYILQVTVLCCFALASCSKLQDGYDYEQSYYDNKVNMNAYDFMKSRPELFSGMLAAIDYVDKDPKFRDIKELFTQTANTNTYLLMHNSALTSLESESSYFVLNLVKVTDPSSPDFGQLLRGTAWEQYNRDSIANLLRYHVLKGRQDYSTLNSTPKWIDTYALSTTNDSAKVLIYLEASRDGYLFLNNYLEAPAGWTEIRPRTPNLQATNGVIHVMNRFLRQPTREIIRNN